MARIAHFIDTVDSGGAERVVVDLCEQFSAQGHDTELMHFGNPWIESQCRARGIKMTRLPAEQWYRSKWSIGGFVVRFAGLLRHRQFDLLHSHLYGPITSGAMVATAAGIGHVGTLHDTYLVEDQPMRFRLLRLAAAMGTQLITVSEAMRRYYSSLARGSMAFERIYNGVALHDFKMRVREEVPKGGVFTFVSMGRLVPIKGFDVLLHALQRTPSTVRLRIIGDGPERAALEAQCRSLGLDDRTEFLGFRDDVPAVLGEADAFVLASRSEGLSCSIVEAMAAALPCIVSDVGGNAELIIDGHHGFLVPPEDPGTLAERMSELAASPQRAGSMGTAARSRAEKEFSLSATVRNYDAIYRSLLLSGAAGQGQ